MYMAQGLMLPCQGHSGSDRAQGADEVLTTVYPNEQNSLLNNSQILPPTHWTSYPAGAQTQFYFNPLHPNPYHGAVMAEEWYQSISDFEDENCLNAPHLQHQMWPEQQASLASTSGVYPVGFAAWPHHSEVANSQGPIALAEQTSVQMYHHPPDESAAHMPGHAFGGNHNDQNLDFIIPAMDFGHLAVPEEIPTPAHFSHSLSPEAWGHVENAQLVVPPQHQIYLHQATSPLTSLPSPMASVPSPDDASSSIPSPYAFPAPKARKSLPTDAPMKANSAISFTPAYPQAARRTSTDAVDHSSRRSRSPASRRSTSSRLSQARQRRQEASSPPSVEERSAKDEFLVQARKQGMSYKDIKTRGNFTEAESTLRGRYRMLTKSKEARVRNPRWTDVDEMLLKRAVDQICKGEKPRLVKIPWKDVATYIVQNGGTYHFGNATCRKKWDELNAGNESEEDEDGE